MLDASERVVGLMEQNELPIKILLTTAKLTTAIGGVKVLDTSVIKPSGVGTYSSLFVVDGGDCVAELDGDCCSVVLDDDDDEDEVGGLSGLSGLSGLIGSFLVTDAFVISNTQDCGTALRYS